mgnify:FL=1
MNILQEQINELCHELLLNSMPLFYDEFSQQAAKEKKPYAEFLRDVLQHEVKLHRERRVA